MFKLKITHLLLAIALMLNFGCDKKAEKEAEAPSEVQDQAKADTSAAKPETLSATSISFDETEHDFGKINEGQIAEHTFKFKNSGTSPLVVRNATASCGCTIPEWTKEPIQPGGEGKILVKYNSSGKEGAITKTVSVFANTSPEETLLTITANVKKLDSSNGPLKK